MGRNAPFFGVPFLFEQRVFFLNVRRVKHDYSGKFKSCRRSVDFSLKPVGDKFGEKSAMVEMRVRQKDGVQFIGIFNDRFPVLRRFSTLLNKSAVDEKLITVADDVMLGTCYVACRATKLEFHFFLQRVEEKNVCLPKRQLRKSAF